MVEELERAADLDGGDGPLERIHEGVLSVEVRSPWINPADYHNSANKPAEYCILLTTGGPALRLVGELGEYGEPTTALLEYQDWFTPWTLLTGLTADEDRSAVDIRPALLLRRIDQPPTQPNPQLDNLTGANSITPNEGGKGSAMFNVFSLVTNALWLGDDDAKCAALYADYDAKIAALLADYNAKIAELDADYNAKRVALGADFNAKCLALYADYDAKRDALYADYYAKIAELDADYNAKRAALGADYNAKRAVY